KSRAGYRGPAGLAANGRLPLPPCGPLRWPGGPLGWTLAPEGPATRAGGREPEARPPTRGEPAGLPARLPPGEGHGRFHPVLAEAQVGAHSECLVPSGSVEPE